MKAPQKTRKTRQPAAPGRWPQDDPEDIEAIRSNRESFRAAHAAEIDRVATALRESGILQKIDSSRWREPRRVDLTTAKLAEVIVHAFRPFKRDAEFRADVNDAVAKAERNRDLHRDMAMVAILFGDAAEAASKARDAAGFEQIRRRARKLSAGTRQEKRRSIGERLDRLTGDLVAVLIHVTRLTEHYALDKVVPPLYDVARESFPEHAPESGLKEPVQRYNRAMRKTLTEWRTRQPEIRFTKADQVNLCRARLFAGDDRFPAALFDPHRSIRTVTTPPIRHLDL